VLEPDFASNHRGPNVRRNYRPNCVFRASIVHVRFNKNVKSFEILISLRLGGGRRIEDGGMFRTVV
jgi:hypothetical protein